METPQSRNSDPGFTGNGAAPASTAWWNGSEIIEALPEPFLVVTAGGVVRAANTAVAKLSGRTMQGANLIELAAEHQPSVSTFLRRCSSATGGMMGAIYLPDESGNLSKHRCRGTRLTTSPEPLLLLRCYPYEKDSFGLFTAQIRSLNREIREHLHTQARLKESLQERELLIREIHHRVKNNIQILQSMLMSAADGCRHPEAKEALEDARRRLACMASVQQILYQVDRPTHYEAGEFLNSLMSSVQETLPFGTSVSWQADAVALPTSAATPLALMINELVTNAAKYGSKPGTPAEVSVRLSCDGDEIAISVRDKGEGFDLTQVTSRSSGLGLVRGLLRQLGGTLTVERSGGAKCEVKFPREAL